MIELGQPACTAAQPQAPCTHTCRTRGKGRWRAAHERAGRAPLAGRAAGGLQTTSGGGQVRKLGLAGMGGTLRSR